MLRHLASPTARSQRFSAPQPVRVKSDIWKKGRRGLVLGIRREDPARVWERRTPLVPEDVAALLKEPDARVLVQRSDKRCIHEEEYRRVGATVVDSLESADVIVGVKEIPKDDILPGKTYLVFNHCHKGQDYNMPLLASMLASGSRILEFELLKDAQGQRLVAFGGWAGQAGMADGLSCLGIRLLALGYDNPFLSLPRPYMSESFTIFQQNLGNLGERIRSRGTATSLPPFTVVITGTGRVAQGAKAVLDATKAVRWITPAELKSIADDHNADRRWIYACQVSAGDYLRRIDSGIYNKADFRANPGSYRSTFASDMAPYTSMLVNGAFWQPGYPRLLSEQDLQNVRLQLAQRGLQSKQLLSIVDVSCDYNGGIEACRRATTIEEPVFYIDEKGAEHADSSHPNSTQLFTIEILPTELPHAASKTFSRAALPFFRALINPASASPAHQAALEGATLLSDGKLRPAHQWLDAKLAALPSPQSPPLGKKRVLLLGSGLVAGPVVEALVSDPGLSLTIASDDMSSATRLAHHRCQAVSLPRGDINALRLLVDKHHLVISLLPASMHPVVARECIDARIPLVTASYVSPDMQALHADAISADVVLLNELGLDPGIDSMSAQEMIENIRNRGGQITAFESYCGGLPVPELITPGLALPYKFSWSPRGVITASLAPALYRWHGKNIQLDGSERLRRSLPTPGLSRSLALEGSVNRDSLAYLAPYGLPDDLPSMLRGTLRYAGTAPLMLALQQLGLFSSDLLAKPLSRWSDLLCQCLGLGKNDDTELRRSLEMRLQEGGHQLVSAETAEDMLRKLALWPGSEDKDCPRMPIERTSALDATSHLMAHRLRYLPGESDMVVLSHRIGYTDKAGSPRMDRAMLIARGDPTDPHNPRAFSSMAKTVGWPVALAAISVLRGEVRARGVQTAVSAGLGKTLLPELARMGIQLNEMTQTGVLTTEGGEIGVRT